MAVWRFLLDFLSLSLEAMSLDARMKTTAGGPNILEGGRIYVQHFSLANQVLFQQYGKKDLHRKAEKMFFSAALSTVQKDVQEIRYISEMGRE